MSDPMKDLAEKVAAARERFPVETTRFPIAWGATAFAFRDVLQSTTDKVWAVVPRTAVEPYPVAPGAEGFRYPWDNYSPVCLAISVGTVDELTNAFREGLTKAYEAFLQSSDIVLAGNNEVLARNGIAEHRELPPAPQDGMDRAAKVRRDQRLKVMRESADEPRLAEADWLAENTQAPITEHAAVGEALPRLLERWKASGLEGTLEDFVKFCRMRTFHTPGLRQGDPWYGVMTAPYNADTYEPDRGSMAIGVDFTSSRFGDSDEPRVAH